MRVQKRPSVLNIWMLSREYGRLAGVGGVKDVVEQLACALAARPDCSVRVVLPLYGFMDPEKIGCRQRRDPVSRKGQLTFDVDMNYAGEERREQVKVWRCVRDRVVLYLLESARFSEKRAPYAYTREDEAEDPERKAGVGHGDFFCVNLLLQKAALELMILINERPNIIHCHDGHTALVPAMIHELPGFRSYFRKNGLLVTIHNGGTGYHQEVDDLPFAQAVTGLPERVIRDHCLNGGFDPFLAAGSYGLVNTVSEQYARELQQTEEDSRTGWLGHELFKRGVVIEGVTNGIDPEAFNPGRAREMGIAAPFDPAAPQSLEGKHQCKQALIDLLDGSSDHTAHVQYGALTRGVRQPLFTFIGRLSQQKGVSLLISALEELLENDPDFQVVFLGTGDREEEKALIRFVQAEAHAGRVCFIRGYAPRLANMIYAAGDFFVIPSEFEPCGLTDFMAQLFGTVPIVHHVGGLVKVVADRTGLVYREQTPKGLTEAMTAALRLYRQHPRQLREIQKMAVEEIRKKYTWKKVVKKYLALYDQTIERQATLLQERIQ